jgi:GT2 family glycosyltransferase
MRFRMLWTVKNRMNQPLVYVIILNYNGKRYLEACLSSILTQTYQNYKVILCDNHSADNSVVYVRENFPSIYIMSAKENLGFAEGNNFAMRHALKNNADFIFLLNNDTIVENDLLEKLVITALSDNSIGIVGPAIYDYTNKTLIQEAGMSIDAFGYPMAMRNINQNYVDAFFISGAALLVKSHIVKEIGLFDKNYFMFAEDLDLCWRTQILGYKVIVNTAAKIFHVSGGSITGGVLKSSKYTTNTRRIYLREKNTITTLIKNYGLLNFLRILPVYTLLLTLEAFLWFVLLKPKTTVSLINALCQNLKDFSKNYELRLCIQSKRKVSDENITRKIAKGYGKAKIFQLIGIPNFK